MRALTVRQPWADLIVAGVKDVENRTWPPPSTLLEWYLCEFCLHRQQRGDRAAVPTHLHNGHAFDPKPDGPFPFRLGIHAGRRRDTSNGAKRAWVALREARGLPATDGTLAALDVDRSGVLLGFVTVTGCHHADDCEHYKPGNHCSRWAEPDVYHWELADPEPLDEPVPMRGHQGLWTLPEGVPA